MGVKFKGVNVLDPALRQGIKEFANWPTIPQLYVKGEFVGGRDIVREMYNRRARTDEDQERAGQRVGAILSNARKAHGESGRACRFWGAVLLAALLFGAAAGEPPADAAILDAFAKIAFGSEYEASADPRLQKWAQPIRWRAHEALPLAEDERAFLERHMARLARLTGLEFAPAPSGPNDLIFVAVIIPGHDRALLAARQLLAALRRPPASACSATARASRSSASRSSRSSGGAAADEISPPKRRRRCSAAQRRRSGRAVQRPRRRARSPPLDELLVRLLYDPAQAQDAPRGAGGRARCCQLRPGR
jgi:hypothetical protein